MSPPTAIGARLAVGVLLVGASLASAAARAAEGDPTLELSTASATVGDRIGVEIAWTLPAGTDFAPPELGPTWGAFDVVEGSWSGPTPSPSGEEVWRWSGAIAAYRTGELELPARRLTAGSGDGARSGSTPERAISIESVLEEPDPAAAEGAPELADLKGQVGLRPDPGPLAWALGGLVALGLAAALLAWLHRRYAARLAAVEVATDVFRRTPPHEWVYAELQKLLERRLPEEGRVDRFYEELSRIVRRYLGGRYRVELMERTTEEIPPRLSQAGAGREAVDVAHDVLRRCDAVKFAGERPGPAEWKGIVEDVYRVVDVTRPRAGAA